MRSARSTFYRAVGIAGLVITTMNGCSPQKPQSARMKLPPPKPRQVEFANLTARTAAVDSAPAVMTDEFLARVEQVKAFRIIPVELDPEQGETTPTRKIKRGLMYRMFSDLIEEMYRGSGAAAWTAESGELEPVR